MKDAEIDRLEADNSRLRDELESLKREMEEVRGTIDEMRKGGWNFPLCVPLFVQQGSDATIVAVDMDVEDRGPHPLGSRGCREHLRRPRRYN